MYFEISRKELLPTLKMIIGVVEQRQTLPILANTLIRVKDDALYLTATDAEVEIACNLPLESGINADSEGETTIPARKFFDICKSLSDTSNIQVAVEDNESVVKSGRSRFKLQTLPAIDFPDRPQLKEQASFTISQRNLKDLFYKTSFCIAVNDVRYYLNGVLLETANGKISLVGTDGHRMAVAQLDFANETEAKVIIPRKAVLELSKLLTDTDDEIEISFDDNHIRFKLNNSLEISSKLIDGDFPDWQNVIPADPDKIIIAETHAVKQALTRTSILSNEKYKGVRLALSNNQLNISAKNSYQEEAEEIVEVEYTGEELEIGFNGIYLLDAINVISTKMVQIALSDGNSSCLITEEDDEDSKFIVMPMRL
ncbi:DNA polymerase III subunit beta [Candidatus Halobeggiatoa sp. HSG11]|nr:DNA polymerase III subunit beta [Candidatus Halobeggiatoa sp. HSG11]